MYYVASSLSLAWSTFLATGRVPRTSPPLSAERFSPSDMAGAKLVYLCLHSLPEQPYLYGDRMQTAITAEQIEQADLRGAIVYLAVCYGLGPISSSFLRAGAAAVVADPNVNWAGTLYPAGANRLGMLLLRGLREGLPVGVALASAKRQYRPRTPADRDLVETATLVGDPTATVY